MEELLKQYLIDNLDEYEDIKQMDELGLMYLREQLIFLLKQLKRENKREIVSFIINNFIYNFNKLVFKMEIENNDELEHYMKKILNYEREEIQTMLDIMKYSDDDNELYSDIYLIMNAINRLNSDAAKYYYGLLKKQECENKGLYYFSNQTLNIKENEEAQEKIYSYVKKLQPVIEK